MGILESKALPFKVEDFSYVTSTSIFIKDNADNWHEYFFSSGLLKPLNVNTYFYMKEDYQEVRISKEGEINYINAKFSKFGFVPYYSEEEYYQIVINNQDFYSFFLISLREIFFITFKHFSFRTIFQLNPENNEII